MTLMCVAEFGLWVVLCFLFWRKKLHRRFPAMADYLALRVASAPVLLFFLYGQSQHWLDDLYSLFYFYAYWAVYFASAMFLFFVCIEVFRSALSAFSGLQRLGTVVFRWVALASVIMSLSTISFANWGALVIPEIANKLMHSVSIVELCLLGFLCLSMNALRLSGRDMAFGIAVGFGMMTSSEFILASFFSRNTSLTDSLQFVSESLILVSLGIWVAYCALPERARQPIMVPVNSTIYRWNEIASSLGHTKTQVAARKPAKSFFPTDVEWVVVTMLKRSLKDRESET
jgi:hypothetical protein